MAYLFGPPWK